MALVTTLLRARIVAVHRETETAGSLGKQLFSVGRKICAMALPPRKVSQEAERVAEATVAA